MFFFCFVFLIYNLKKIYILIDFTRLTRWDIQCLHYADCFIFALFKEGDYFSSKEYPVTVNKSRLTYVHRLYKSKNIYICQNRLSRIQKSVLGGLVSRKTVCTVKV